MSNAQYIKIRYEIDPHNRLIETGGGLRRVLDGTFKTDDGNALVYHLKKPVAKDGFQQVKFSGTWALDKDHHLVFSLDKWGEQIAGNKLVLKTEVLSVSGNELAFSLGRRDSADREGISILRLNGAWQVDRQNRLNFFVERQDASPECLKFQGAWLINRNYEAEYTFSKTGRGDGRHTLVFKGQWQVSGRDTLTYVLGQGADARLDLQASLQHAFSDKLVFVMGARRPSQKKLVFSGGWRFDKGRTLSFELARADGRVCRMVFGAQARLKNGLKAEVELIGAQGRDLGVRLVLSKSILGGEAFLKFLKDSGETAVLAGFGKTW